MSRIYAGLAPVEKYSRPLGGDNMSSYDALIKSTQDELSVLQAYLADPANRRAKNYPIYKAVADRADKLETQLQWLEGKKNKSAV